MPLPFGSQINLSADARGHLEALVRAGSTPQALVFRCRVILRAADIDEPTNQTIAHELHCDRHTVGQWRERFAKNGLTGLQDAPRAGRPRAFSPSRPRRGHHDRFGKNRKP